MANFQRVKDIIARFDALDDPRVDPKIREASKSFVDNLKADKCPLCGKFIRMDSFVDQQSIDEHKLSHLCQACQDECFGPPPS